MYLAESGIKPLNELLKLLNKAKADSIALFEHQFSMLSFGSFVIVVGRPKDRLRFTWDGRDRVLEVGRSAFNNQNSPSQWEQLKSIHFANNDDIFGSINSIIREEFKISLPA